jgi:hypothetical protein
VRAAKLTSSLDSPVAAMLLVAALSAAFVGGLLARQNARDPSRLVLAGDRFSDPATVPPGLFVWRQSDGYDGQFFYRLAVAPFDTSPTAHGITIDLPYRHQRIVYPLLAWITSFGSPRQVPLALLQVNLVALCLCALVGGALARSMGRHALWGVLPALYPGFLLTLARDTAEIVAVTFMLAGLLALRHQRRALAAAAWSLAVLTRETALLIPLAGLALALHQRWRPPVGADADGSRALAIAPFALPVAAFCAWQLTLFALIGRIPLLTSETAVGAPFAALVRLFIDASALDNRFRRIWFLELLVFVGFVALVLRAMRSSAASRLEKTAFVLALGLAIPLSRVVWVEDWAFMRALSELHVFGALVVIGSPRPWLRRAALAGWLALYALLWHDLVVVGR